MHPEVFHLLKHRISESKMSSSDPSQCQDIMGVGVFVSVCECARLCECARWCERACLCERMCVTIATRVVAFIVFNSWTLLLHWLIN